jgi:hypothetical protein
MSNITCFFFFELILLVTKLAMTHWKSFTILNNKIKIKKKKEKKKKKVEVLTYLFFWLFPVFSHLSLLKFASLILPHIQSRMALLFQTHDPITL